MSFTPQLIFYTHVRPEIFKNTVSKFLTVEVVAYAMQGNPEAIPAVNYYHKALHLGCCSSPRSASAI